MVQMLMLMANIIRGGVTFNIYNGCKIAHAYILLEDDTSA